MPVMRSLTGRLPSGVRMATGLWRDLVRRYAALKPNLHVNLADHFDNHPPELGASKQATTTHFGARHMMAAILQQTGGRLLG
jgi:hypothetical protein